MSRTVLCFVCVIIYAAISFWLALRQKNLSTSREGYFLGGRTIGVLTATCSMVMGFLSGMVIVGFPAYGLRINSTFYLTCGFGLMGFVYPWFGYKMWYYGKKYGYITTADYIRDRYDSPSFGLFIAIVQVVFMIPYICLQFSAFGKAMEQYAGVSHLVGMIIFAILIVLAVYLGGAKGAGTLDILNACLGFFLPIALIVCLIVKNGGISTYVAGIEGYSPDFVTYTRWAGKPWITALFKNSCSLFTGFFCLLFGPHCTTKMFMIPSRKKFISMSRSLPFAYLVICLPLQLLTQAGIAYCNYLVAEGRTDDVLFEMLNQVGSTLLIVLFLMCILAFCTSTANAFAVCVAACVSHDFVDRAMEAKGIDYTTPENTKKSLAIGRIGFIVVAILAIILGSIPGIYIIDYAYSLAGPGFSQVLPPLLFGLFWRRGNKYSAWIGMIVAMIVLIYTMFINPSPLGVAAGVWATLAHIVVYVVIAFFVKPDEKTYNKFFARDDRLLKEYYAKKA